VDNGKRGEHRFFQQPDARHLRNIHHQDRDAVVGDGPMGLVEIFILGWLTGATIESFNNFRLDKQEK
jgi:hypothetical protein